MQQGFDFTQAAARWYWERRIHLNSWYQLAREMAELNDICGNVALDERERHKEAIRGAWSKVRFPTNMHVIFLV